MIKGIISKLLKYFNLTTQAKYIGAKSDYLKATENFERLQKEIRFPPGHYYSSIHDIKDLPSEIKIDYASTIPGIELNDKYQLNLLNEFKLSYRNYLFTDTVSSSNRYYFDNDFFGYSDGIFLSSIMLKFKPKRIIEVGSGFSSALMMDINEIAFNGAIDLKFIEPYPEERLLNLISEKDKCTVIKEFVQNVNNELWQTLEENDILFIDSSHVSKFNSDVNHLFFNVLPKLKSGVIIHIHDIFYPFDYPIEWLKEKRAWTEAYLLRAFLQHNNDFEILLFTSYMEGKYRGWFQENMPECLTIHKKIILDSQEQFVQTAGQSIYIRKR